MAAVRMVGWLAMLVLAGWWGLRWLAHHPEHDPRQPLALDAPFGWALPVKLARVRLDGPACRDVLRRSAVGIVPVGPRGVGACRITDALRLTSDRQITVSPAAPVTSCPVNVAMRLWLRHSVGPAARRSLGSDVVRIDQLGTASCRRIAGTGGWSEHASANAIDVAGFVLADGTRISVARDWRGASPKTAFLHEVRNGACRVFAVTLSPDYNAAHADHLHLDQGSGRACR